MSSPKRSKPNQLPTGNILYSFNHMVGSNVDPLKNIPCSPPEKRRVAASRSKLTQSPKCKCYTKQQIALSSHGEKCSQSSRQNPDSRGTGNFQFSLQGRQNIKKWIYNQADICPQNRERAID